LDLIQPYLLDGRGLNVLSNALEPPEAAALLIPAPHKGNRAPGDRGLDLGECVGPNSENGDGEQPHYSGA